jgi:hypothetical protein
LVFDELPHRGESSITIAGEVIKQSQEIAVVALEFTGFENAGVFYCEILLFFLYLRLELWIVGKFLFIEFKVLATKVPVSVFVMAWAGRSSWLLVGDCANAVTAPISSR